MKKVLVVAYYYPPMGMGGVQRTAKFVRYLSDFGWEPTVLTVKPIHYYAHDNTLLEEVSGVRTIRTDSMDPLRLQFQFKRILGKQNPSSSASGKSSFLEKVNFNLSPWLFIPDTKIPWVPWAVHRAKQCLKKDSYDLIFTTSPPHSVHLVGRQLKKKTSIPWVADFRDNWLAEAYEKLPTPFHRMLNRQMATSCVQQADHVIAICDPIADYLRQLSGKSASDFTVLPNGFDRSDFDSVPVSGKNKKLTISYCGGLYPARSPEPFFKGLALALNRLPAMADAIHIRFVGSINGVPMAELINKYGLNNVVTTYGYVTHDESIRYLCSSDLLLLLISSDSSPGIVTGKVFEYLASEKPVLGIVPQGEAAKLLVEHQRGWVVHPDDIEHIAQTLLKILEHYQKGKLMLAEDAGKSVAHLERYEQTRKLAALFDAICNK